MATWRSAEILNALQRLGFVDKPGVGDHVRLFKSILKHPDGPATMQTGIDMGQNPCSKKDIGRIKRQTHLSEEMWEQAMSKKLSPADYDGYLRGVPLEDLVLPAWRQKIIDRKKRAAEAQASQPDPPAGS